MSDEQVGKLLRMMKSYHNGNEYVCDDFSVELVFEQFKNQFERDIENYNTICARNKEIADKRWGSSKDTKSTSRTSRTVTIPESTRSTHNDNDNDSDSDNKNDNENINNNITPSGDGESVSKKVSKNKKDIFTKEEEVLFNQFWDKYPRKDAKG
jgi:hypothetical protein